MPLTDTRIRNARYNPEGTGNTLTDGGRMKLDKSGAKYWRMNYRFAGKDKTLALGLAKCCAPSMVSRARSQFSAR